MAGLLLLLLLLLVSSFNACCFHSILIYDEQSMASSWKPGTTTKLMINECSDFLGKQDPPSETVQVFITCTVSDGG